MIWWCVVVVKASEQGEGDEDSRPRQTSPSVGGREHRNRHHQQSRRQDRNPLSSSSDPPSSIMFSTVSLARLVAGARSAWVVYGGGRTSSHLRPSSPPLVSPSAAVALWRPNCSSSASELMLSSSLPSSPDSSDRPASREPPLVCAAGPSTSPAPLRRRLCELTSRLVCFAILLSHRSQPRHLKDQEQGHPLFVAAVPSVPRSPRRAAPTADFDTFPS